MERPREYWVDNVKLLACIFVAVGHLVMSMGEAGLMQDNLVADWFIQTIYYFHVPLFFICSGYLYQKFSKVTNVKQWGANVLNKLLALGVPYFVFLFATWLLKTIFSSSVNTGAGDLLSTLFLSPAGQFWYLYVLFFIFLITPTSFNRIMTTVMLFIAIGVKIVSLFWSAPFLFISGTMSNLIWFVLGVALCSFEIPEKLRKVKIVGGG